MAISVNSNDVHISYLPLAHMFERGMQARIDLFNIFFWEAIFMNEKKELVIWCSCIYFQIICFMHGCRIGFFRGDVKLLTDDMQALKPTLFITVPRLLNRIYDRVGIKRKTDWMQLYLFGRYNLLMYVGLYRNWIRNIVIASNPNQ